MINPTVQSQLFWKKYSVPPPAMYVAASTGPKDVLLVLDTSGSMANSGRLNIMKDAAKRVINTLSVSDYVSVVTFNTDAQSLTSSLLQRATADQKKNFIR